jgi:nucleotidyltransferase substrate binding protein (TIGR01987 family)
MKLDLTSIQNAVKSLEQAVTFAASSTAAKDSVERQVIMAGVIQNFEFTFELCWKFMQRSLETNFGQNIDVKTRRDLFRLAAEHNLIEDAMAWVKFSEARNKTSHIYDQGIAAEVFEKAKEFLPAAKNLLNKLEEI